MKKTDEWLKDTIRKMIEHNPGLDEYDISGSLEIPLMKAIRLCSELVEEGVIRKVNNGN